ncbi:MAG: hypothetical protein J7M29_10720 [Verrucomicrobia bacterium]|nr:hypothetical protein [Verrucomicrobiota bacterium]
MTAIVALLLTLLIPAINRSRNQALAIRCLRNMQQLQLAWMMYADDNEGRLPAVKPGAFAGPDRWISGWLDMSRSPDNTNTLYLVSPEFAQIGPYVASPVLFRCPADPSFVKIGGREYPRVRSVSMNCWMNYRGEQPLQDARRPHYRIYRKITDFLMPPPSGLWVLIDERFDSINDGMFTVNLIGRAGRNAAVDSPAAYHNGGAGVAFADGHAIVKRWKNRETFQPVSGGGPALLNGLGSDNPDVYWLQNHATGKLIVY